MKKKIIIVFCIIIALVAVAVPVKHFYIDNTANIAALKEEHPEYFFDAKADENIEIYVWQLAEDNYLCGALLKTDSERSNEEIIGLSNKAITVEEMKKSLSYCKIPKENITIIPCVQPNSSYSYTIDDEYTKRVEAMFDY